MNLSRIRTLLFDISAKTLESGADILARKLVPVQVMKT